MHLDVITKDLLRAIKTVSPAISNRAALPALTGLRLQASEGRLDLAGTDLDLTITVVVDAAVSSAGATLVSAKTLQKVVSACVSERIAFTTTDTGGISIEDGSRTIFLPQLPLEDWPRPAADDGFTLLGSIPAVLLVDALAKVVLCASGNEARAVLTSVVFFITSGSPVARLVATDSYRLGIAEIPLEQPADASHTFLVPARTCAVLAKLLGSADGSVELSGPADGSARAQVRFQAGNLRVESGLVEGEFPNWETITPTPGASYLDVDAAELASAIKAADSVTPAGAPVRLELDGECTLVGGTPETGELRARLTTASFTGGDTGELVVGFNPGFLADALRFVDQHRVRVYIVDGLKPALFEAPDRRHVLMPVRPR